MPLGTHRIRPALAWRLNGLRAFIRRRIPHPSFAYAIVRGQLSSIPLPPGNRLNVVPVDRTDRTFLRRQTATFGPVFAASMNRHYCVCVVGLARGRRLLQAHADDLVPVTVDIAPLVPGGFMRQMEGDPHRHYRRALLKSIRAEDFEDARRALTETITNQLVQHARTSDEHGNAPPALTRALLEIATTLLLRLFFGRDPATPDSAALHRAFRELGPAGMVWDRGPSQVAAFTQLRDLLRGRAEARTMSAAQADRANCIFDRLVDDGMLDETMLGNLVYMVEMGRTDIAAFLRWLTRHVGANPAIADQLATRDAVLAEAFVLETLRTNQSERLMRRARRDIVFEGVLIPRYAFVQLCMWESHHDDASFPHPLQFDPTRFLQQQPGAEAFSPFGLDQHICPFASFSIDLGVLYLQALTTTFSTTLLNDGPSVIGAHHWAPSPDSSAAFVPHAASSPMPLAT